jgi:Triose-phosphate Transporter family
LALITQVVCFPKATSPPLSLFLSIVPVVGGVMLAVATELSFDVRGFAAAFAAAVVTAFQANFSAKILGGSKLDSIHLLYYQSPFAVIFLVCNAENVRLCLHVCVCMLVSVCVCVY